MHNSPSSCGQSSSEGLADAIGQGSELGFQQTQRQQSAAELSAASVISAFLKQLVGFSWFFFRNMYFIECLI
jgi:hypothetical protein